MSRRLLWAVCPAVFVLALDQLTKVWIASTIPAWSGRVTVIPGFFDLIHVYNEGAAFSLLADAGGWQRWFFVGASVFAMGILGWLIARTPASHRFSLTFLGLVLGGAAGNLVDRARMGRVLDFLDVYVGAWHWPSFNVADSAISVGVVGLILLMLTGRERW